MAGIDQFDKPGRIDMRIDLRRDDIGMAKQGLQHAQVRPALKKVSGKGMAQDMRLTDCGFSPARPASSRSI